MQIWKIFFYILLIPVMLYLSLFLEYISFFSLPLVFAVFFFRDLKRYNYLLFFIFLTILLDITMHFWMGTFLLSITVVLLILLLFDRLVSHVFLNFFAVFLAFFLFRIFFLQLTFFQETMFLQNIDTSILVNAVLFALKNMLVYLVLKVGEYFFKSYIRDI
jgi:hypothetical protein